VRSCEAIPDSLRIVAEAARKWVNVARDFAKVVFMNVKAV
jgi:hypothetical protein